MKCHKRCSVDQSFGAAEIPVLLMSFFIFRLTEIRIRAGFWMPKVDPMNDRFLQNHQSGGEFGWSGTYTV